MLRRVFINTINKASKDRIVGTQIRQEEKKNPGNKIEWLFIGGMQSG